MAAPVTYAPSSRSGSLLGGLFTSTMTAQLGAYGSMGTLFAIVNKTSSGTAQVNWRLWRKAASGLKEDRVEVTAHAALTVWNKPNSFYTRQEFVEAEQQHVDLTGEGWWVVERNPRVDFPIGLWPVRPDRITPLPSKDSFIAGYEYTGPDGETVPLGVKDVIGIRMPNPLDPYRGLGPVQSVMIDVESARYTAEWNRNFFRNGAAPGGIVEVEKRLSDTEFDEMVLRWREQHQGVAQAHRVAIIEQGHYIPNTYSMTDMQFVQLRAVSKDTVREAFAFPTPMLGTSENVNRANAEAAEVVFSKHLITPRLERFKSALNNDFLPMFGTTGQGVEFDYDDPTPPDAEADNAARASKTAAAATLVNAGWNADEVLSVVGLPPMSHDPAQRLVSNPSAGGANAA
jgi:HK97 family phage portal protein